MPSLIFTPFLIFNKKSKACNLLPRNMKEPNKIQ